MKLTLKYGRYNILVAKDRLEMTFGWLLCWDIPGTDQEIKRFALVKPTPRQVRQDAKLVRKLIRRFMAMQAAVAAEAAMVASE